MNQLFADLLHTLCARQHGAGSLPLCTYLSDAVCEVGKRVCDQI